MEDKKVELTKEQIIENQKKELQRMAAENCILGNQAKEVKKIAEQLKEELRIARSDNETLKEAIVNRFVSEWGGRA
ncbi:MAG: hypothetical protein NC548_44000 [Lachnospiraceae bacterium]|nr:hypothetical protein [Lachnospiraceae bacterium]